MLVDLIHIGTIPTLKALLNLLLSHFPSQDFEAKVSSVLQFLLVAMVDAILI
jgi:hypothetical protein